MFKLTYIYVTFKTTNDALNFEDILKNTLPFWLVPVPRELTHNCGIAARFKDIEKSDVENLINQFDVNYDKIYKITK
ncbi:MAG: hypothetical protein FD141_1201 [Fusobacteria bacterium]|nr:MAG: hypothetical protein FD141_1201 [Fusobacteriota bacterium]KAF0229914.1 MAG: hypothetical protein FD182_304 [Fusobacteriota bacterium]